MQFADKILVCVACLQPFLFTADEQRFFFEKQFVNTPKRCKSCRAKRNHTGKSRVPQETRVRFSVCHQETTVPFKPTQGRPVLCRACFQSAPKTPSTASKGKSAQQ